MHLIDFTAVFIHQRPSLFNTPREGTYHANMIMISRNVVKPFYNLVVSKIKSWKREQQGSAMIKNYSVGLIGNKNLRTTMLPPPAVLCSLSVSLKVLMIIAYSIVIATLVVGNTLLAVVYFKSKSMKNTVNRCIMNMTFADLLLALFYMLRMLARIFVGLEWLVDGMSGLILCKIVSLSQEISICVPSYRCYHRLWKVLCGIVAITISDIKKTLHGLVMLHLAYLAGCSISDVPRTAELGGGGGGGQYVG